ncbi:hypothetical protein DE4576_04877 [Mycobacterium marinum]|nr:hypothetical protein DE4576_04877 [Mycobacterium marinum]
MTARLAARNGQVRVSKHLRTAQAKRNSSADIAIIAHRQMSMRPQYT